MKAKELENRIRGWLPQESQTVESKQSCNFAKSIAKEQWAYEGGRAWRMEYLWEKIGFLLFEVFFHCLCQELPSIGIFSAQAFQ